MIFTIDRTSTFEQPCEEAFRLEENSNGYAPWGIKLDSLEELMLFVAKYERIIVTEDSIEIYDDFRE